MSSRSRLVQSLYLQECARNIMRIWRYIHIALACFVLIVLVYHVSTELLLRAIIYNYLGDTYSSHVNTLFWKVHGWVDNRIEDWKAANDITGDIQWTGTWIGHMEAGTMPMGHIMLAKLTEPGFMQEMEQVSRIIAQSGVFLVPFRLDLRVDLSYLA